MKIPKILRGFSPDPLRSRSAKLPPCLSGDRRFHSSGDFTWWLACIAGALLAFFPPGNREKEVVSLVRAGVPFPHCYSLHGQVTFAAGRLERLLCRLLGGEINERTNDSCDFKGGDLFVLVARFSRGGDFSSGDFNWWQDGLQLV